MTKKFNYVDGYVLPLPRKNVAAYKKMATLWGKVCRDHGVINYVECIADDVKKGKVTSFPQSVKLKKDEVVVFAWATYKSKTHRDQVMKKVYADPRLAKFMNPNNMLFDGMRMFWGGFKPTVKL